METRIKESEPSDLRSALTMALKLESIHKSYEPKSDPQKRVRASRAKESSRNTRKGTLNEPRTASGTHNNGGRTENTSGLVKDIEELKELLRATVFSRAVSPPSAGSCVSSDRPLPAQQKPASKQISYRPGVLSSLRR